VAVVLEGDVQTVRHPDGRMEVTQAPPRTRIALALLLCADPAVVRLSGSDTIVFAGQVSYRVTGWDGFSRALLADRVES